MTPPKQRQKKLPGDSPVALPNYLVGWREWVSLLQLGVGPIGAKVDTGARTSALHATHIERFERDGKPWVSFCIYPNHRDSDQAVEVAAPLRDVRHVRNSGGVQQRRVVIRTEVQVGTPKRSKLAPFVAEFTLVERSEMAFPVLLGRTALRANHCFVDPARSYLMGRRLKSR